jgi:hypothetical protein
MEKDDLYESPAMSVLRAAAFIPSLSRCAGIVITNQDLLSALGSLRARKRTTGFFSSFCQKSFSVMYQTINPIGPPPVYEVNEPGQPACIYHTDV